MADATARGRFVWHELATTDTAAAAAFYPRAVAWKTQAWENDPSYTIWLAPGGPAGGLMTLPDEAKAMGAPSTWLAYVATPDVAATVADARRLGGRVLKDVTEVAAVGRFAVLADPQGAVFAAFTPAAGPMGGENLPQLGQFSWHELATTDREAAFGFYQQLFGWERTGAHDMGPMGTYQLFGLGATTLGGIYDKPKEMPAPPHWLCYASVEDAARAADEVKAAGGQVLHGPVEVPGGGWIAQCLDPQGAAFAVHSAAKVPPAKKRAARKARRPAARKARGKAKRAARPAARKGPEKRSGAARKGARAKRGRKRR